MSYKYMVVQNKIEGSKSYNAWFARGKVTDQITTEALCDEIAHSTTVTESDVRAVFAELKVVMRKHLLNNHSVKVDGLGTFFVRLKSSCVEAKKDFTASKIKGASVGFLPESATVPQVATDKDGKTYKIRYKKLLEGITFEEMQSITYTSSGAKDTSTNTGTSTEG